MKVWEVGVSDCESSHTFCICSTKEIAIRELFKKRDELVEDWKRMHILDKESHDEFIAEQATKGIFYTEEEGSKYRDIYGGMVKALSSDDYENWDNYPHEVPWISETEVLDS